LAAAISAGVRRRTKQWLAAPLVDDLLTGWMAVMSISVEAIARAAEEGFIWSMKGQAAAIAPRRRPRPTSP